MNSYLLNTRLGSVTPAAFHLSHYDRQIRSIEPDPSITFSVTGRGRNDEGGIARGDSNNDTERQSWAHGGGVNVLTVDQHEGRFLFSGGVDASLRLWDLESLQDTHHPSTNPRYRPAASLSRGTSEAHSHALTSLSIYPLDPVPATILSSSYDTTFKLSAVTPTSIQPIHTFSLNHTPHSHSLSPLPSSTLQIAVATSHPAIQLLDLRSGFTTHSLPGHTAGVLSCEWSRSSPFILASASLDSRALLFDIRRSNSAFVCFDLDDPVGVVPPRHTPAYGGRNPLDWNARAHAGPVTGIVFSPSGRHIITCGHDQRIRVWDSSTGANTLVHFGPRIRNSRIGEFTPLITPHGMTKPGKELLIWANDDSKGEIMAFDLLEGTLRRLVRFPGTTRKLPPNTGLIPGRFTGAGRINCMQWRLRSPGGGCELISGHGDGGLRVWRTDISKSSVPEDNEIDSDAEDTADDTSNEQDRQKKRKRDILGEIVEGLTKKPITFT